jgi:hypothetical protein
MAVMASWSMSSTADGARLSLEATKSMILLPERTLSDGNAWLREGRGHAVEGMLGQRPGQEPVPPHRRPIDGAEPRAAAQPYRS